MENFTCSHCHKTKSVPTNGGTGYGENRETGAKTCYNCIGIQDRVEMVAAPIGEKFTLYLSQRDGKRVVTNWPGTLEIPVRYYTKGRHNIARTREDIWFHIDNGTFWGVQYGENTLLVHCKKIDPK